MYDTKGDKLEINKWTHVAISYDPVTEEASLYLNGIKTASRKKVPTQRYVYYFCLGGDPYKPSFKGYLSELIIYPELKRPDEIRKLYDSYI